MGQISSSKLYRNLGWLRVWAFCEIIAHAMPAGGASAVCVVCLRREQALEDFP
jgi:hypothetical protein